MHVFFATPAYRGIKCPQYIDSMLATAEACNAKGYQHQLEIMEGCCYVQAARNELVRRFLDSGADVLFFLDDDISWPAAAVIDLLEMPDEMVAGVYPMKIAPAQFPAMIYHDDRFRPIVRSDGCISAKGVPTGFLRIKRSSIAKLMAAYPQQKYDEYREGEYLHSLYDLFPQGVHGGRWVGEDFAFCRLWTDIRGEIWIKPDIDFSHFGDREYHGNYHQFLLQQPRS